MNYIQIAPKPAAKNLVSRSSFSGSYISEENYKYVHALYSDILAAKLSFPECMQQVHDRTRSQLIQNWVAAIFKSIKQYPQLEVLSGGETQPSAVT